MLKKYATSYIVKRLRLRVERLLATRDITIIIVTGTVGKTTAKVAIGEVLTAAGRQVCYSDDSYNTEVGIPLAIFGLKAPARLSSPAAWRKVFAEMDGLVPSYPYDTVVIEVAEDERAMMAPWLALLKPSISVLTGATPAHMERFETVESLRDDAVWLATQASRCYYNADMPLLQAVMDRKKSAVGYGLKSGTIRFDKLARTKTGKLDVELIIGKQRAVVKTQLVARQGLSALLAAAAVAHELAVPLKVIATALGAVEPVIGRMRLLAGINQSRILDDSYNASPDAVTAAIDTLMELPARSHIAVLGSMNELGDHSAELHRQVGLYAAQAKPDMLIVVGKEAGQYIVPAAIEAGLDKSHIKQFRTPYEAGHFLKPILQPDDLVLVKGSQNAVFTEETSRILLSPDLHPSRELVRQSKTWKARKKKSFGM